MATPKCANCPNPAVHVITDPGVDFVYYCASCLPPHFQARADAGHFSLDTQSLSTARRKAKTVAAEEAEEAAAKAADEAAAQADAVAAGLVEEAPQASE